MKKYVIWPVVQMDGGEWSVPDVVLEGVFKQMAEEGRFGTLFYTGYVKGLPDWMNWCHNPANLMQVVVDAGDKKIAAVTWLNNVKDGTAEAHFCMLGPPHPELGETVLAYWAALPNIAVIVGCTPENYTTAIKYAKRIGFKEAGMIPQALNMAYEGRRVGAVMTYYLTEKE